MLVAVLVSSCTLQYEDMGRNNPSKGDTYRYALIQWGGQGAFESSSGTRGVMNNETSFKDFMQTVGATATTVYAAKAAMASEVTKRIEAGEITKQQGQQLQFEIAKIQTEADLAKFQAALAAQP